MATYRLDIHSPNPWALMPSRRDGSRFDGTRRHTYPAILRQVEEAAYAAMRGNSLLDRPIAHDVVSAARRFVDINTAPGRRPLRLGYMQRLDVAQWSFCVYRER